MSASVDLVFLDHATPAGAKPPLLDGIRLFEHAERLGDDSGRVRVHHGVSDLSAPVPFSACVAEHVAGDLGRHRSALAVAR